MMNKSELSRVIGTRLQRLRKSKGYTQQMIADLLFEETDHKWI